MRHNNALAVDRKEPRPLKSTVEHQYRGGDRYAKSKNDKQSEHNGAVYAAQEIYQKNGRNVWINPGSGKNKEWAGRYIDVIATETPQSDKAGLPRLRHRI